MDKSMVDALIAQGMSRKEAYDKMSYYYQSLAEGRSRSEARRALRSAGCIEYLNKLVRAAFRDICSKGFNPEEVVEAMMLYCNPEGDE